MTYKPKLPPPVSTLLVVCIFTSIPPKKKTSPNEASWKQRAVSSWNKIIKGVIIEKPSAHISLSDPARDYMVATANYGAPMLNMRWIDPHMSPSPASDTLRASAGTFFCYCIYRTGFYGGRLRCESALLNYLDPFRIKSWVFLRIVTSFNVCDICRLTFTVGHKEV